MKKVFSLLLIAAMLIANSYAAVVEVNIGGIQVNSFDGEKTTTKLLEEVPFVNESGRTMVPVRAISEAFGSEVSWDGEKQEVKIVSGENVILLTIDSNTASLNGSEIALDSAPVIKGGRTFVPLRFIGESFGYNINYVATTRQIIIDDTEIVISAGDVNVTFAEIEALFNIYYQVYSAAAKAQGMTDEEFHTEMLYRALQTAMSYAIMKNTVPGAVLNELDIENIKENITTDSAFISLPLEGLSALMHEKLYYVAGAPALNLIMAGEDVEKMYKENYICAKHILVDDEETANAVIELIQGGADFDALVAEYGKDPGMEREKDGYVFTYGMMVKPFEEAAYALEAGEISYPVMSDFGYHIIKREELPEMSESFAREAATSILSSMLSEAEAPTLHISQEELLNMLV